MSEHVTHVDADLLVREMRELARRLDAKVPPGHADYVSKGRAAAWIGAMLDRYCTIADEAAVRPAAGEGEHK